MRTIIITGPSGSGKTFLSKKLSKLFLNTIIINTDSFYRDNKLIKFLSLFFYDIYDRPLSIKKKDLMNNIVSINNKSKFINTYNYDFKERRSLNKKINLNYNIENQFLIIEGIFSHRLDINYKESINIICEEDKSISFKRRLNRDQLERERSVKEVYKRFSKSWYLFYRNIEKFIKSNDIISLNTLDNASYDNLASKLINLSKKITKKNN